MRVDTAARPMRSAGKRPHMSLIEDVDVSRRSGAGLRER